MSVHVYLWPEVCKNNLLEYIQRWSIVLAGNYLTIIVERHKLFDDKKNGSDDFICFFGSGQLSWTNMQYSVGQSGCQPGQTASVAQVLPLLVGGLD